MFLEIMLCLLILASLPFLLSPNLACYVTTWQHLENFQACNSSGMAIFFLSSPLYMWASGDKYNISILAFFTFHLFFLFFLPSKLYWSLIYVFLQTFFLFNFAHVNVWYACGYVGILEWILSFLRMYINLCAHKCRCLELMLGVLGIARKSIYLNKVSC